jgi:outer membrane protein assembly factor BamB
VAGGRARRGVVDHRASARATAPPRFAVRSLFIQGMRGRDTMVHSINLADGKYLWSKNLGSAGSNDRGSGPRSTPTIDGDRVYVLTERGDLWCLKDTGAEVWHRNILTDFAGSNIQWLLSESPLVDGDRRRRHSLAAPAPASSRSTS